MSQTQLSSSSSPILAAIFGAAAGIGILIGAVGCFHGSRAHCSDHNSSCTESPKAYHERKSTELVMAGLAVTGAAVAVDVIATAIGSAQSKPKSV